MGRQDDDGSFGNLGFLVNENRTLRFEVANHVRVVHDLLSHVHRPAVLFQRKFDGFDCALDSGAIPSWNRKKDFFRHDSIVPGGRR